MGAFILYAFPAYLPLVLAVVAIFGMHTPLTDPDLIFVLLLNGAIFLAAVLMVKGKWWICLPMLALGIFLAMQYNQHIPLQPFGYYLILHYAAWGVYTYRVGKNPSEREKNILFSCGVATAFLSILLIY